MSTCDFVDQRDECGESWWILGQVSACRIVDPKKFLASLKYVARLPVKLRVRTDLKPPGIVEMRAHELQRKNAHANRDEKQRKEYRELFSIDPQRLFTQRRKDRKERKDESNSSLRLCDLCAFA